MKKKKQIVKSTDSTDDGQAGDYRIGQVSGSLFPDKLKSGALSSLFSTSSSANTLVFVPAPKAGAKVPPAATDSPHVKNNDQIKKQKTIPKTLSAAEKKLQDRESALQNADDDGQNSAKKVKRKHPDVDDATVEQERPVKRKKNMAVERIKMRRTVFVGNLPPNCTKKILFSLFKQTGAVESVRFRSVVREDPTMSLKVAAIQRKVHPKKTNINAYVVFKEEDGAASALKLNGQEIQNGFHIRVDRVSQQTAHDHKRSIFVGNLPYDIMELPLRQHFEECGNVEAVRLVRDRESGMGKGFGYILFKSPDSVMLALKLDGSKLQERKIRVKRSVKKEKEKKTAQGRPFGGKPATGSDRRGNGAKGGFKGPQQEGRNKTGRKFMKSTGKNQTSSSFKGEMADPMAKKGKRPKKKFKLKKNKSFVNI
ncbi:RNA-binding protein 34 isoform X2 [Xyrauchen texanus]|uniref:RNA-binding protein 34 isoform X2 n=1 Tax=Xyrauchen texanus TaxID=154827 RepID=UPI002242B5DD|nr:RNA-binding protein 34 isoform X2 [Xyrauchen texanus]